jgi:hypothetical protein
VKPDVGELLGGLAQTLLSEVVPLVSDEYTANSAGLIGMLLMAAVEEQERAAAWRVEENAALRSLFAAGREVVTDTALRERLETEAAGRDESLRVSDLARANETLRALLIDLHAHVETLGSDAASTLEERIWSELRLSTERRSLTISPF